MELSNLLTFFLIYLSIAPTSAQRVVNLGYTSYKGQVQQNGIVQWLGMRFAAAPLGELRFSAPQDPPIVGGIQDANEHGSLCIPSGEYPIPDGTSEDCLFLDVYSPTQAYSASKPLPVFVYIQGGGYNENGNPNYNGTGLIQASNMGIVVVTFNYRVGPYGFLASAEVVEDGSPNNGIKDQIKVLRWVQQHIRKFGGDPNHVVVGGSSAGAGAITLLLTAYGGRNDGLFHATAAESQSFAATNSVNQSQFAYDNLVIRTGCASSTNTLQCLRNLDAETLQLQNFNTPFPGTQIPPDFMYRPTIDNDLVPDYTYRLFQQARFIKVPVIFGDDTDEGTLFVPKNTSSVGEANTYIQGQFPNIQPKDFIKINSWYLKPNDTMTFPDSEPYWRPASTAFGEMRYVCSGIAMSSIYACSGVNSWNYHYDVRDPTEEASGFGVPHTSEISAIWGPQYVPGLASYTTVNAAIVPVMQGYWTSFIKHLNPNPGRHMGSPEWKQWGMKDDYNRIHIQTNQTRMERVPADQIERCEYLVGIGAGLPQ